MAIIYILAGAVAGFVIKLLTSGSKHNDQVTALKRQVNEIKDKMIEKINAKDKEVEIEKKRIKEEFDKTTAETRNELVRQKSDIEETNTNLEKKADILERKEAEISDREKTVDDMKQLVEQKETEVNEIRKREQSVLQQISRMSPREAREQLMRRVEEEATEEAQRTYKRIVENTQRDAQREAVEIISQAIQRNASEVTQDLTVTTVAIPDDDMKGRIIGREGRNIRSLEHETGVNLIIDDTPGVITISSFDGVRREVAKRTLSTLLKDGRIQPARIEEIAEKIKIEVNEEIKKAGEEAAMEVGVLGIHDDLIKILGKLKYRTSYGQNVLEHSMSVAHLAGFMADEMEIDKNFAIRAGLLHDIGKAVDREMEGNHVEIGAKLAKKYGESERVQNAILSHHEDVEPESAEAILIQAADTISASRPGARREHLENYIKRITDIENIAKGYEGIKDAYCVAAGREVRIIVEPGKVNDLEAANIAKMCAKKIEEEMEYPGEIRVTVIRSLRNTEIAK
jgi:ribonuclease Y